MAVYPISIRKTLSWQGEKTNSFPTERYSFAESGAGKYVFEDYKIFTTSAPKNKDCTHSYFHDHQLFSESDPMKKKTLNSLKKGNTLGVADRLIHSSVFSDSKQRFYRFRQQIITQIYSTLFLNSILKLTVMKKVLIKIKIHQTMA